LFLAWRRGIHSLKSLILTTVGLLFLVLLFQDTIAARLVGSEGSSAETRLQMMRLAMKIIKDHPLLGVGANNFAVMIPHYATPEFTGWLHTVHNKYLLVWAEAGLGALVAFLLFLLTTVRHGWRSWKLDDPLLSPLALGFIAGIVGQMSHMFLDLFHGRPQVQGLWLVAGLIVAIYNTVGDPLPDSNIKRSGAVPLARENVAIPANRSAV